MKYLECTIFNVEHGLCVYVNSPNNYGLLIDCGGRSAFSPIKWIKGKYNAGNGNLTQLGRYRIAKMIISHLHEDHFSDIGSIELENHKPKILLRNKETLSIVDEKIEEEKANGINDSPTQIFRRIESTYSQPADEDIDWGFDHFEHKSLGHKAAKLVSENSEKLINNTSYLVTIGFAGKKILIPGDIETEGWEKVFEKEGITDTLTDTNFFVASHHGHKSGFTRGILDYTGLPDLYIVSAREGDEHVDSAYSDSKNSKGYVVDGDQNSSRMVSTRERNASICIRINEDGSNSVSLIDTPDNLNQNQQKKVARRTNRIKKGWNV